MRDRPRGVAGDLGRGPSPGSGHGGHGERYGAGEARRCKAHLDRRVLAKSVRGPDLLETFGGLVEKCSINRTGRTG